MKSEIIQIPIMETEYLDKNNNFYNKQDIRSTIISQSKDNSYPVIFNHNVLGLAFVDIHSKSILLNHIFSISNNIDIEYIYELIDNGYKAYPSFCETNKGIVLNLFYINKPLYDESINKDNYISWDEYFMAIAEVVKLRSKDPNTKVGACIVKDNKILSTGYNGFPRGCDDDKYPWDKGNENEVDNKYFYVVHAELNAILNSTQSVKDSTIYVTLYPCNECAKAIIQSGIKKVIYKNIDLSTEEKKCKIQHTGQMFTDAGVEVCMYENREINISIGE